MECPKCGKDRPRVLETRRQKETITRARSCRSCGHVWQTLEVMMTGKIPRAVKTGRYAIDGQQLTLLIDGAPIEH